MKSYLYYHVGIVKDAVDSGVLSIKDPIIKEYKNKIIDNIDELCSELNVKPDKARIGLVVDKAFADVLETEV